MEMASSLSPFYVLEGIFLLFCTIYNTTALYWLHNLNVLFLNDLGLQRYLNIKPPIKSILFSHRSMHRWPTLHGAKMFTTKYFSFAVKEVAYRLMQIVNKIYLANII